MAYSLTLPAVDGIVPRGADRYRSLAILQVLDVATTWFILSQYTHKAEGNPIVAHLIEGSGLAIAMVALLVVKLAVVHVLWEKQTKVSLISTVYGAVVINNLLALGLVIT